MGNAGRERASAWTWLFSSTKKTTAPSRGVQVQPNDVVDLVHEQGVVGELEPFGSVGLQLKGLPDPPDRRSRQTGPLGHLRPRPVRRVPRRRLERRDDHVFDLLGGHRWRPPRAGIINETVQAGLDKARLSPLADRWLGHSLVLGNGFVRQALRTAEDDPRKRNAKACEDLCRRAHRTS